MRSLIAALASCLPAVLSAQMVRGTVADRADNPVPGVVVLLVDSANTVTARSLSNERGEFHLAAGGAGTYRLRTMRIGFRSALSGPIALGAGETVTRRLVLAGVQFSLDTVRVVGRSECRTAADTGATTHAVWEQIRTALTATQLTAAARAFAATTLVYERTLDKDLTHLLDQSIHARADSAADVWLSLSPDSLRRAGYVGYEGASLTVYHAPGLGVLLSDEFLTDHCLRMAASADTADVGIAFEPIPSRGRIAEIRGTLWLNRATSELRRLDFHYANLSRLQESAGGEMAFARLRDGAWAITRWSIRMPVFDRSPSGQPRLAQVRVAGGELTVAERGGDTLWSQPPLVVAGTISDSSTAAAVPGARVSLRGTPHEGLTDAAGRFSIAGVLPGEYVVAVYTPSLDSIGAAFQTKLAVIDSSAPAKIRVPSARQIAATLCGANDGRARRLSMGVVVGSVSVRGDSSGAQSATVSVEWADSVEHDANGAVADRREHTVTAHTNAAGAYRLCGVPVNIALSLRAGNGSANAEPLSLRIPSDNRFVRADVMLDPAIAAAAAFSGIVVADSTKQPIANAEVAIAGMSQQAVTNENGEFRIDGVPPGEHQVRVRRVGYGPLDMPMTFSANETATRQIILTHVVALDPVVTNESALASFDENRRMGLGHFLTKADLDKAGERRLSSVVEQVPGLRVFAGQGTQMNVGGSIANARRVRPCYAQVYLDNMLMTVGLPTPPFDVNSIPTNEVEGVEFYASAAELPPRYSGLNTTCGVLVIWTHGG
jgi:hypothetical protein